MFDNRSLFHLVEGTVNGPILGMGVAHDHRHGLVPGELLDRHYVGPRLREAGTGRVPHSVGSDDAGVHARRVDTPGERLIQGLGVAASSSLARENPPASVLRHIALTLEDGSYPARQRLITPTAAFVFTRRRRRAGSKLSKRAASISL